MAAVHEEQRSVAARRSRVALGVTGLELVSTTGGETTRRPLDRVLTAPAAMHMAADGLAVVMAGLVVLGTGGAASSFFVPAAAVLLQRPRPTLGHSVVD